MCGTETGGTPKDCGMVNNCGQEREKTLVFIASDRLGQGDDELGSRLLLNFLKTLPEMAPWRLVLVNNGVRLTVGGSPAAPLLQNLVASGVSVLACATCLDHFGLLGKQEVGEATNMVDIVTSMQVAEKVITL